jgi:nitrite reductase (NADH) small subunit
MDRSIEAASVDPSQPVNLGPADRIPPGEGRVYVVGGRRVAVFRPREGGLFATQAGCPHRQGPLADGLLGAGVVVCPLHAFKFQLATGAPAGNDCAALTTYPVAQSAAGDVLLTVEAGP